MILGENIDQTGPDAGHGRKSIREPKIHSTLTNYFVKK